MKVKCIGEGRRHAAKYKMSPGDVLDLPDKIAESFIQSGHVQVFNESEVVELAEEAVVDEKKKEDEGWIGKPLEDPEAKPDVQPDPNPKPETETQPPTETVTGSGPEVAAKNEE